MKILFRIVKQIEKLLRFAIEGRKCVKDQLMHIDTTYGNVCFSYKDSGGKTFDVVTLEETKYANCYAQSLTEKTVIDVDTPPDTTVSSKISTSVSTLQEKHLTFQESQKGLSFDILFGDYLKGTTSITVTDHYIRLFTKSAISWNFWKLSSATK